MNRDKAKVAIAEAQRFIEKAKIWEADVAEQGYEFLGTAKSGAMRRASMDLTRALADLRRYS